MGGRGGGGGREWNFSMFADREFWEEIRIRLPSSNKVTGMPSNAVNFIPCSLSSLLFDSNINRISCVAGPTS